MVCHLRAMGRDISVFRVAMGCLRQRQTAVKEGSRDSSSGIVTSQGPASRLSLFLLRAVEQFLAIDGVREPDTGDVGAYLDSQLGEYGYVEKSVSYMLRKWAHEVLGRSGKAHTVQRNAAAHARWRMFTYL